MNTIIHTPVLFQVFNRPEKTQRVFDVIRQVKPLNLYVAADGPRAHLPSDKLKCENVREIVKKVDWDCNVRYLFQERNLGCALSQQTTLKWFFNQEEEVINIEDDGLASISFFGFAQELLERYRFDNKIVSIGSDNYGKKSGDASYFFTRFGSGIHACATWKRVYNLCEFKLDSYLEIRDTIAFRKNFVNDFAYKRMIKAFDRNIKLGGNPFDIILVYLAYKYDMLNIVPNTNLCSNIGYDFEGANNFSVKPNSRVFRLYANKERYEIDRIVHPKEINVDPKFEKAYYYYRVHQEKSPLRARFEFYIVSPVFNLLYPIYKYGKTLWKKKTLKDK